MEGVTPMKDEIVSSKSEPPVPTSQARIDIRGGQNTVYGQIGTIQDNRSNVIIANGQTNQQGIPLRSEWEYEYYNLFVVGGETFSSFSQGNFVIPKESALTQFVAEDICEEISKLDEAAMKRIKGFFCIFAPRNIDYATPGCNQQALLGMITEIQRQDKGFKITYQTLNSIPLTNLHSLSSALRIDGKPTISELDITHWSIKKANLVDTLRKAGISCFLP